MAITWADVALITGGELNTLSDDQKTEALAEATEAINPDVWGVKTNTGIKWMAAHLATLAKRRGVSGAVTGETVGSVSRQYANPGAALDDLAATSYGAHVDALINTLPAARLP